MTIRAFNSVQGYSVGQNPQQDIILANGDITTVNFTANGVSTLGPIGNVKITGGTNGQFITTDGAGNLTFADSSGGNSAAPMPYYVETGNSYLVPNNFQGLFSQPITIDGTFEVDGILIQVTDTFNASNGQVLFDYNGTLTGNTGFTFDYASGNFAVPGGIQTTGDILPSTSNTYSLGSTSKRWNNLWLNGTTIYLGSSVITETGGNLTLVNPDGGSLNVTGNSSYSDISVTGNISGGNLVATGNSTLGNLVVTGTLQAGDITVSSIANGTSNVDIIGIGGNVTTSVAGNSNVFVVTGTGANVNGYLSASGNVTPAGIKTDNYYYANGSPVSFSGTYSNSNVASYLQVYTGNITAGNISATGNISGSYLISSSGCVTIGAGTVAVSGTSGGIFVSTITDINFGLSSNIVMGSSSGNVTVQGNLVANGKVTGTTLTGSLTTAAQPNVTSVGTLTNLTVSGNVNTGNITVTNTVDAVNVKVTDLFSKRTSINISTNTPIDTFPTSSFRSAKYTMRAGDGTDYQALEVLLVHNDINSIITVYGSLSTSGTDLVAFTTDISAGNVNVYATAVGPNTNLNLMGTYVPD